jgi:hypothetical protein
MRQRDAIRLRGNRASPLTYWERAECGPDGRCFGEGSAGRARPSRKATGIERRLLSPVAALSCADAGGT